MNIKYLLEYMAKLEHEHSYTECWILLKEFLATAEEHAAQHGVKRIGLWARVQKWLAQVANR